MLWTLYSFYKFNTVSVDNCAARYSVEDDGSLSDGDDSDDDSIDYSDDGEDGDNSNDGDDGVTGKLHYCSN